MSSFSNQNSGGIIIFGIDEDAGYIVTGVYDAQDLQKKLTEQALQMEPVVRPLLTVAMIDDKLVVSAEIAECDIYDKPCFYKGAGRLRGSYIRVGDADQPMTEYEIYSYEAFKRRINDELRTVERATMAHLQTDNVTEYLIKLRRQKANLIHLEDERILETQGVTQNGLPTLAGLMLFGEYPQEFFPQLSVTAMAVSGKEIGDLGEDGERFIDNKRIEGTLAQMLEGALAFVRQNMKVKTIINEDGKRADKPEYPHIAGALEIMIDTENQFSGISTVIAELKKAAMPAPVFIDRRGVFKVQLYKKGVVQEKTADFEQEIIYYCRTPRTREELAARFGFEAPSYFIKMYIWCGIPHCCDDTLKKDGHSASNMKHMGLFVLVILISVAMLTGCGSSASQDKGNSSR